MNDTNTSSSEQQDFHEIKFNTKTMENRLTAQPHRNRSGIHDSIPISKLHDEILMLIFGINANMNDDEPLQRNETITRNTPRAMNTTVNSSQVSLRWRNLIIDSPLLWAKLIDIHALNVAGNSWREEVIRRTKGLPLHVKGLIDLDHTTDVNEHWWVGFFNDHWDRIRIFDVVLVKRERELNFGSWFAQIDGRRYYRPSPALPFLSRPTTTLESFHLDLSDFVNPQDTGSYLFDGHAPRLRFLQLHNLPFKLRDTNLRFSQIESLHIIENFNNRNQAFPTIHVLFNVLYLLPRLRSLCLSDAIGIDFPKTSNAVHPSPTFAPIHLPSLNWIAIKKGYSYHMDTHSPYWQLLENIIPKPGCSIQFFLSLHPSDGVDVISFSRWAENYLQVHRPRRLLLWTSRNSFRLTVTDMWSHQASNQLLNKPMNEKPVFEFDLSFGYLRNATLNSAPTLAPMYKLLEATLSLSFPSVIVLQLSIPVFHQAAFTDPSSANFLSSFSSLQKLSTTHPTLHSLCTSPVINIATLFPRLKVLEMPLEDLMEGRTEDASPVSVLTTFLNLRREASVPLPAFEYKPRVKNDMMDLTFLDAYTNLGVLWNTEIFGKGWYVCGSGEPEMLNFKERFRVALERPQG